MRKKPSRRVSSDVPICHSGSSLAIAIWLHLSSNPQSSRGTFIILQIMASGNRAATSVTRSHSPVGVTSSTISRAIWRAVSSNLATARGRNDALYDLRNAVCSGGSVITRIAPLPSSTLVLVSFGDTYRRAAGERPAAN